MIWPENRAISPPVIRAFLTAPHAEPTVTMVSAGCGAVRRPLSGRSGASVMVCASPSEDLDLGVEPQQNVREDHVEREDQGEGDDDRLVDRSPHADGPTLGGQALVTTDHADDEPKSERLDDAAPKVRR